MPRLADKTAPSALEGIVGELRTLGARRFAIDEPGALAKNYPRRPIIEDNVVLYAGASVLGRITVDAGSVVAGSVWLTQSVPPGSVIIQASLRHESEGAF